MFGQAQKQKFKQPESFTDGILGVMGIQPVPKSGKSRRRDSEDLHFE